MLLAVLGVATLTTIRDATARQIIRRELDIDVIARGDADAKAAQPTCKTRQDRVTVLQLDLERRARERLDDASDETEGVLFG